MFNFDSINEPVLYILTLNENVITEEYIKEKYLSYLWPEYAYLINKETGEKKWLPTKKQSIYARDLQFTNDRWENGKTLADLTQKTCFCIAEFGDQHKPGTSYVDTINSIFKDIIKSNIEKYELNDVTDGLAIPIDKYWKQNTGEDKPYTGYLDPRIKGILTGWMRENNITLKEFLENPKYILFLDSDFTHILLSLDDYNMISDKIDEIYCI